MKTNVLGVEINADTKNTIIFLIKKLLGKNRKIFIATPYSEMLVAAQKDSEFKNVLNAADFAIPDGIGVLWAAHYLKTRKLISSLFSIIFRPKSIRDPIPEKISGSNFVWDLAGLAADRGYSIFLLGGFGNTGQLAAAKLKSKFPHLRIAGTFNGGPDDRQEIMRHLTEARPDFLFVAFGPIRQEKWIYNNLPDLPVKLAIGLGGTFDYLAGNRPPAPRFWAQTGLEWLWRLITQPWRVLRILKGVLGLIWYSFKARLRGQ